MTFGRFVNKWRIFKRPLHLSLKKTARVYLCATRLHNYCINEGPDNHAATSSDDDDEVDVFIPSSYDTAPVPGTSNAGDFDGGNPANGSFETQI